MLIFWLCLVLLTSVSCQIISDDSAIASVDESRMLSTVCKEGLMTYDALMMSWAWCGSALKLLIRDGILSVDATVPNDVVTLVLKDPLKLFISTSTGTVFTGFIFALQQSAVNPDLRSASLQSQFQDLIPSTTTTIAADALLTVPNTSMVILGEFNYVRSYSDNSLQLLTKYQTSNPTAGDRLLVMFAYGDVILLGKTSAASQIIKRVDHSLVTNLPTAVHGSSTVNRYASMLQDSLNPSSIFACLQADGLTLVHKYNIDSMYLEGMKPLASVDVTAYGLSNNILNFGPYQYVVTIPSVTSSAALTGFFTISKLDLKLDFHVLRRPIGDRSDTWTGFRMKADRYYFSVMSLADRCLQSYYLLVDSCIERFSNNTCKRCIDGYYKLSSTCLNLTSVPAAFGVSGDSIVSCYDDNCMNCSDNYQICTECDTSRGYILANGACNPNVKLELMAAYDMIERQMTIFVSSLVRVTDVRIGLEDHRTGNRYWLESDEYRIEASHRKKIIIYIDSPSGCQSCFIRLANNSASSIKDASSGAIFRGYPIEQGPTVVFGRNAVLFSIAKVIIPILSISRYLFFLHSFQLGIWYALLLDNLAHLYHVDGSNATVSDFLLHVVSRVGVLPFPVYNPLHNEDSIRSCIVDKKLVKKMIHCAIGDSYGQSLFAIYYIIGFLVLVLIAIRVINCSTKNHSEKLAKIRKHTIDFAACFFFSCHMNLMYFGLTNLLNHDEFVKGMIGWFISIKFLVLYVILFINMTLHSRNVWAKLQIVKPDDATASDDHSKIVVDSWIDCIFPQTAKPAKYSTIASPLILMIRSILMTMLSVVLFKHQTILTFVSLLLEVGYVGYLNFIGSSKTTRLIHLMYAVYYLFSAICSFNLPANIEQSVFGWTMCCTVMVTFLFAAAHCIFSMYKRKKTAPKSTCTEAKPDSPDLLRQESDMIYSVDSSVLRDKNKNDIISRRKNLKLNQIAPNGKLDRSNNPFEKYKKLIVHPVESSTSQNNS